MVLLLFLKMQIVQKDILVKKLSLLLNPVLRPLSPPQKLSLLPAQIIYIKVGEGRVYSMRHSVSCFYLVRNASSSLFLFQHPSCVPPTATSFCMPHSASATRPPLLGIWAPSWASRCRRNHPLHVSWGPWAELPTG